jgi:KipI family sensor histidine kinase inhibitor
MAGNGIIVFRMQIAAAGDRALLISLPGASSAQLRAAADALRTVTGVIAAIVGHESIYVIGSTDRGAIAQAIDNIHPTSRGAPEQHGLEVSFGDADALDLTEFLARIEISRDEFLRRLADVRLSVRYLGFRAGFAYLEGWPEEWRMPRRPTSRNLVPRGSFGIAGVMAGFYPVDSPGGWNILGRTNAPLWDPAREPPNLLFPGDEVAIVPTRELLSKFDKDPSPSSRLGMTVAEVIAPGQLTTIVGPRDWSRVQYGLTPGGPFDEESAAAANRAVGNRDDAPLLECVLVGPRLRFPRSTRVALYDGECREWSSEEVDVGRLKNMRAYLAIEGGVDEMHARYAEAPTVVKRGDRLSVWGPASAGLHRLKPVPTHAGDRLTIRIIPGPHDAPPFPHDWEVTPQLNRVGIRLRPLQIIAAHPPADLPSCGMQFGTLQWHPDGSVMAMGPDHPVTGGYLQPATVVSSELWKLAQLAPGDRVSLVAE